MSFKQRFHFRHIIQAVGWKMNCEWCGGKDWESDRRKVTCSSYGLLAKQRVTWPHPSL